MHVLIANLAAVSIRSVSALSLGGLIARASSERYSSVSLTLGCVRGIITVLETFLVKNGCRLGLVERPRSESSGELCRESVSWGDAETSGETGTLVGDIGWIPRLT